MYRLFKNIEQYIILLTLILLKLTLENIIHNLLINHHCCFVVILCLLLCAND